MHSPTTGTQDCQKSIQAKQEIEILKSRKADRNTILSNARKLSESEESKIDNVDSWMVSFRIEDSSEENFEKSELEALAKRMKHIDLEKITLYENCENIEVFIKELNTTDFHSEDLVSISEHIDSASIKKQLFCLVCIRKILSKKNPPIQTIYDLEILPRLKNLLAITTSVEVKSECAWIMINLALGDSKLIDLLVQQGVPQTLVRIVSEEENFSCADDASWALGNIACEGEPYRVHIIEAGGVQAMVLRIKRCAKENAPFLNVLWSLGKLTLSKKSSIYNDQILELGGIFVADLSISEKVLATVGLKQWLRLFTNCLENERNEQAKIIFLKVLGKEETFNRLTQLLNHFELLSDSGEQELILTNKALIIKFLGGCLSSLPQSEKSPKFLLQAWLAVLRNLKLSERLTVYGLTLLSQITETIAPFQNDSHELEETTVRSLNELENFLNSREGSLVGPVLRIYLALSQKKELSLKILKNSGARLVSFLSENYICESDKTRIFEIINNCVSWISVQTSQALQPPEISLLAELQAAFQKLEDPEQNRKIKELEIRMQQILL